MPWHEVIYSLQSTALQIPVNFTTFIESHLQTPRISSGKFTLTGSVQHSNHILPRTAHSHQRHGLRQRQSITCSHVHLRPYLFPLEALYERTQSKRNCTDSHGCTWASSPPHAKWNMFESLSFTMNPFKSFRFELVRLLPHLGIPMHCPGIHHYRRALWYVISTHYAVLRRKMWQHAGGYNRSVSFMTQQRYGRLTRSTSFNMRPFATLQSISALTFCSTSGLFNRSDIAHSRATAVVSTPAINII